jgi:histidyl-tRNA synthetase
MKFQKIRGTRDILPEEARRWQKAEALIRTVMASYGFGEIRTPIFEETELFARSIGQLTDIVSKEMYTFKDRGEKSLTLRPELTAPVLRAFIENNLGELLPLNKLYYLGSAFRQENPQAGRLRQFHQFGAEILGSADPAADAEAIALAIDVYLRFGLTEFVVELNSVGDATCREPYKALLRNYLRPRLSKLCETCRGRFESNPLRILDCKVESCRAETMDAPHFIDHLCQPCADHFAGVRRMLEAAGIELTINHRLVRGLDYYTRTAFEIIGTQLGAQDALCGGGRYDLLCEELGGKPTPAIGFAAGMERLMIALEKNDWRAEEPVPLVFFAPLGAKAQRWAFTAIRQLRRRGWRLDIDLLGRGLKAQLREANRQQAVAAVIVGDNELQKQSVQVRNLRDSTQAEVPMANLEAHLSGLLDNLPNQTQSRRFGAESFSPTE